MMHMTRLMAADLAPKVRVNAIAVGSIATSALEVVLESDELRTQMIEGTPLKRLGEPDDIALAALYLASPASSFVTGKVMEVDGGLEEANLELGLPDLDTPILLFVGRIERLKGIDTLLESVAVVSRTCTGRNLKVLIVGGGDQTEDIVVHHVPRAECHEWLMRKGREGYSLDPKLFAGLYFLEREARG